MAYAILQYPITGQEITGERGKGEFQPQSLLDASWDQRPDAGRPGARARTLLRDPTGSPRYRSSGWENAGRKRPPGSTGRSVTGSAQGGPGSRCVGTDGPGGYPGWCHARRVEVPSDVVLQTDGLTKFYGRQRGIEDLSLAVHSGEIIGFLGPNGAGKTTTIRMLLGLIRPTRGQARLLGLDMRRRGVEIRAQAGYLPGDLALYERMRGEDLLGFLAAMRGGVPSGAYRGLAERFDLDLRRRVGDLSKGNRQKLGVVQAFMHSPRLLILDEPTSGLDPLVQLEFQRLVHEVADAGSAVFLSSHVLSEVDLMADRVAIVNDGRLVLVDDVDGLREHAPRRVELDFPVRPPDELADAPHVRSVQVRGRTAVCQVTGPVGGLLKIAVDHGVADVHSHDPTLEDAFLGYVTGGEQR